MASYKDLVMTLVWASVVVVLIDLGLGLILGSEYQPKTGALKNYFSYGFSVKRKLESIIGRKNGEALAIARAGWNVEIPPRERALRKNCEVKVTFYGMSFSNRIAMEASKLEPCLSVRLIAGPGAPLSHSFWEYEKHGSEDDAEIIVVGVLASSVRKISTVAHFTSAFEAPGSHLYPRYYFSESKGVIRVAPPYRTLSELRTGLAQDPKTLRKFLAEHDDYYSSFVYGYQWLDGSVVIRMLRRAYGQVYKRTKDQRYFDARASAFTNFNQSLDVVNALLQKWQRKATLSDTKFVVLLINDRGYAAALDYLIGTEVNSDIEFLTTSKIVDSTDLGNFLSDGHFLPEIDKKISEALLVKLGVKETN